MANFRINYDAIRRRIKDVSTIDTETVSFVEVTKTTCPDCSFDPINKESTNPSCPTCDGKGFIETETKKDMIASVDRITGYKDTYEPGGRLPIGTVRVTIHESELNRVGYDIYNTDWVSVVDKVIVGGNDYIIDEESRIIPQTLQGEIYEIIFYLSRKKT